jgi:multidrug efflux pump subunit AcrA (membrane-fusion protein)
MVAMAMGIAYFTHISVAVDPPVVLSKVVAPQLGDGAQNKDKDKEKEKDKEKDKDKPKSEHEAPKPETVKVEKGPLTAAVVLKGTVQSEVTTELSVRLKTWTGQLVARKAVEHGTVVKAGDVLVEFESEKLDREIRDARHDRDQAQLAISLAEIELPILEKQAPLDLAAAERDYKQAVEDMKRFVEVDKKMTIQSAEFTLKSANFYSEYAKDELKQLQKMYRDKDLTEETEQMILKRYKHSVESAELYAAFAKLDNEHTLKIELPRREQNVKTAVEKAELNLIKARDSQPLTLKQKKLALAHLHYDEAKAKEHLAELDIDRAALTVKAPVDGLAYHGRFVNGQLMVPAGSQGPALHGVGLINPGDVFLTIVSTGKLVVRAEVEEKEISGLKPGLTGKLTPTAFTDKKLPCEITRMAVAPHEGKFEVRIKLDGKSIGLVPGMTGSARFVTTQKKDALTVLASAVFEDTSEDTHYVYRVLKGGKHEKKTVKVGITSGDKTEILEGLAEGDEILTSKP